MRNDRLKKLEQVLILIFVILAIVAVIGIILLIKFYPSKTQKKVEEESSQEVPYNWEDGLSDNTLWLPSNCYLYSKIPEFSFQDEKGKLHSITEFIGKPVVIVFWASWCSDCKEQMPFMNDYIKWSKKHDVTFLFINKLDGEKETKDTAVSYFKELGIDEKIYYDEGLKAYEQLGIHNIPTTLFLDSEGILASWSPKQITKEGVFQALLNRALNGASNATSDFIITNLLDEKGGVHSLYNEDRNKTSEILSESQGAMLEYATLVKNQDLFNQLLEFVKNNLWSEGLTAWQYKENKASNVNALIDDFRIYNALVEAQTLWGGYEETLIYFEEKLLKYGQKDGKFIDFFDEDLEEYANRFTLCYADFEAMDKLTKRNADFVKAYENSKKLVLNGQISDEFPLYYSWYNYSKKRYEKDDLNTAEAMTTLLHLSEAGLLPDNTLTWLKKQMKQNGIKARYNVKGEVVDGYNYDSTAVYALITMIGKQEKDIELVNQALKKMEKMRIDDTTLSFNGAFGMEDGSGITSFDQLMPLLTYMEIYGK